ncbi:hypothetical protein MRB53_026109 [Persea americana]|uniref:Uncharacterized protein n=1 Tax=Persea americana TaxID=3435 RepID=A0ACC2LI31_PERAE|nr:hypothetical protein MRB53_026109 [Persea americana]
MLQLRHDILDHLHWFVGNEENIGALSDQWIPRAVQRTAHPNPPNSLLVVISSRRARQINLVGPLISSGSGGRATQWRGSVAFPLAGRIYPAGRRKRLANA